MNATDDGGSFVVYMGGTTYGIMCENWASNIPSIYGELTRSSKLNDGGVRIHISCAITTYKFIINRINILIIYIN